MSTATQQYSGTEPLVGPRLKVARENAGLTQEQLARRVGVETASVAAWESGERQPRANRLMMLCGVLDVSIKWLLEGAEGAYMARGDDPMPGISAELTRLRTMLSEAERVVDSLSARVEELRARRRR